MQSTQDFTLCVVVDHCDDNSIEIVHHLCANLPANRLQVLPNAGSGLVDALNTGLSHIASPLVARMDADDIMHPDRLAQQSVYMRQNSDVDVLASCVRLFPSEAIQQGFAHFIDWQNTLLTHQQISEQLYVEAPVTHPSVMFKKQTIIDVGGYKNGDFPEDYELWLRLHAAGACFAKLSSMLTDWRESPTRLSRTAANCRREAFDALRAAYLYRDPRIQDERELIIWGAGRPTRKRVSHLLKHGITISKWIDIDPNKIGNTVQGLPVISPDYLHSISMQTNKPFVLVYVSKRGAREEISAWLNSAGYVMGTDYLCVG